MRIDKIVLYNFGSYEGENVFFFNTDEEKNIVLIGGKNGAGKTTLFTAMRVCLYGYMSMGYKSQNAFYSRAITKLINNTAKLSRPTKAYVKMQISQSNGRDLDVFEIDRTWVLDQSITESLFITKNGIALSEAEVTDFEKYLLSLIPPELFNLYFFDGEKIADFFLNEGGNTRIKESFLTLCGYDTFDIMRRNFKRISNTSSTSPVALDDYLQAKQNLDDKTNAVNALQEQLTACVDALLSCDAEIVALEKNYSKTGGITQEEWNDKLFALKDEERKRDNWNAVLRKWANEVVPFIMLHDQLLQLKAQIEAENDLRKYQNFCEILDSPEISKLVGINSARMKSAAFKQFGAQVSPILDLSFEQCMTLFNQISEFLEFDKNKIAKYKGAIKRSIALSATLRDELDKSNVSAVQDYMKKRADLFEQKSDLLNTQVQLEQEFAAHQEMLNLAKSAYNKAQEKLEEELKKASINDISTKAILMLDKLQQLLYRQQISKVEEFFRNEIRILMRKSNFIDDIKIDDDFKITVYRHEDVSISTLMEAFASNSEDQLTSLLGDKAILQLQALTGSSSYSDLRLYCSALNVDSLNLPIRIDQASLSNGEKQIFIMTLYHSLVQLTRHEIPFIIDTPFARIDAAHRQNISKNFFSNLKGQVFILSTDEEINTTHVGLLHDKIAATYILENSDNKRTRVVENAYFEVGHGI